MRQTQNRKCRIVAAQRRPKPARTAVEVEIDVPAIFDGNRE